MKINEENFVKQLKVKNEKALEYVIDTYGWLVKSVISKQLFGLQMYQEECMNDVLMAIWENIGYYQPEKNSFQNWAAGIARYKSVDYLRKYLKEAKNQSWEEIHQTRESEEMVQNLEQELSGEVEAMLGCLNERDQEIFRKLYLEELDMETVSLETGMKKEQIYNRVSRGKKRIRKLFT